MKVRRFLLLFTVLVFLSLFYPTYGLADVGGETPGSSTHCIETCSVANKEKDCATSNCDACYFCHTIWRNANDLQQFQETIKSDQQTGQIHQESFNHNSLGDIINSASTQLVGEIDWETLNKALESGKMPTIRLGGALGSASQLLAAVIVPPPVSGVQYLADLGRNLGIVTPAYAQGVGFDQLQKLLPIWKAFRNLAYFFFVIIFIAIGLMIMFRVKLDPKTVITIQNAIPKVVIALILVTFSYAIAGLLIDLIYLIIYVGVLALSGLGLTGTGGGNPVLETQQVFSHLNFGEVFGKIFTTASKDFLTGLTGNVVGGTLVFIALEAALVIISLPLAGLLPLLFLIIIFFLLVKLFFKLVEIYINIIILVIFAPLIIMLGVLPNSKMGFSSWFVSLLKKILVFPAIALVLLLAQLLSAQTGPDWTPPVLGTRGLGMIAIISLGMLLLINKIPDAIEAAFANKPFAYGTAIGEALGPVKSAGLLGADYVDSKFGEGPGGEYIKTGTGIVRKLIKGKW